MLVEDAARTASYGVQARKVGGCMSVTRFRGVDELAAEDVHFALPLGEQRRRALGRHLPLDLTRRNRAPDVGRRVDELDRLENVQVIGTPQCLTTQSAEPLTFVKPKTRFIEVPLSGLEHAIERRDFGRVLGVVGVGERLQGHALRHNGREKRALRGERIAIHGAIQRSSLRDARPARR
ncbi:MAG: hypothetical protein ACLPYS_10395 [Vulcanimicrobiaceae bacterium]